ncbi:PREDICTED: metal transporter Nramp2-like [Lupinus angustifolius]|uniref:metal transporter Nramp2-like n=1 Tax=Lupinus angustifolius TaxID=3871 RepID=UPI00092E73A4|nr:PREDICTED: metal transporter Nramp2-like [Lupinus angustifolius]
MSTQSQQQKQKQSQYNKQELQEDDEAEENRLLHSKCEAIPLSSPHSFSHNADTEEDAEYAAKDKVHIFDLETATGGAIGSTVVPPFSWKKLWLFTGPGLLMSIAFLDPGNLEGDLQAGAVAGYSLKKNFILMLLVGILIPRVSSKTLRQAVEIVGCVITPHNVFLHSALVQSRDIDIHNKSQVQEVINYYSIESSVALLITLVINLFVITVFARVFYGTEQAKDIGLVNAGQYLEEKYGGGLFPILYIWGIGLLAAGQSSTITGTYAGQFITEGFLKLNIKKWLRALITRSCAIVPTMIVAIVFNTSEGSLDTLNEWLNVLQAIQIPFALIPLLTLVSKEEVMGTFRIGPIVEVSYPYNILVNFYPNLNATFIS